MEPGEQPPAAEDVCIEICELPPLAEAIRVEIREMIPETTISNQPQEAPQFTEDTHGRKNYTGDVLEAKISLFTFKMAIGTVSPLYRVILH
jgi:hypothetical protein